jgi:putative ABC transport system substrate-binding protein
MAYRGEVMNSRRKLIIALGAGVLVTPLDSFAQQQREVWRVGFLSLRRVTSLDSDPLYDAFPRGMRELGYIEGKNLLIDLRSADGKSERLSDFAAEFVRSKVDLILAGGTQASSAAQKATTAIPIIFVNATDPLGSGFVRSLARPGGNITGISNITGDFSSKHLDILLGVAPNLSRVAVLVNPANSSHAAILETIQTAAQRLTVKVLPLEASSPQAIEKAFLMTHDENAGAVIVVADALFTQQTRQLAELAVKYRLPSISTFREFAEDGILITYGPKYAYALQRAAVYADKIFKGATPAELPVEQPTTFELVINLKTAKAIGLTIPQPLLVRADEVIQ